MNHLLLIGFMGTGKTSVGIEVARKLHRPFLDLDEEIHRQTGRTAGEWITDHGEESFRATETRVLKGLALREPTIIACGGGVVLREANRQALSALGPVIRLVARADVIAMRLSRDQTRPLLATDHSLEARIIQLQQEREKVYALFPDSIDTSERTVAEVAQLIIEHFHSCS